MIELISKIRDLIAAFRTRDWPAAEAAILAIVSMEGAGSIANLIAAIQGGQIKSIVVDAGAALAAIGQLLPDGIGSGLAHTPSPMADRPSE